MRVYGSIHFTDGSVLSARALLVEGGMVKAASDHNRHVFRWYPMHKIDLIVEDLGAARG